VKQEKPVVKRRLNSSNKQATLVKEDSVKEDSSSLAAQAEVASYSTVGPSASSPVLRRPKSGRNNRSRAATNKYRSGFVIDSQ